MIRRNVELKARLADIDLARRIVQRLEAHPQEVQHQIDTYFHCTTGRLKLREINGRSAQLIWYARPDQEQAKGSDYTLVDTAQPALLKETLTRAHGQWLVVDKRREIYLWHNVRIHLDQVVGLGTFLEFEAVLTDADTDEHGHEQLRFLSEAFRLTKADLVAGSYSDLLANRTN